ncbi:MAG: twin-arginine translocase subunit TatC [Flavobacteriales bacterium]|jgi:sec-independent protein translocase protein TatC|nr:twin-arginine translocase subunit TatC [Schleiferiaceae bacterium]|tara:strand:+ start:2453 stop:3238 length:786 start_codon:yes stop_codon:yes gene_type:complete
MKSDMPFLQHLAELRKYLVRAVLGVLVAAVLSFVGKEILIDQLLLAPKSSDFITYQWFCELAELWGMPSLCIEGLSIDLLNTKMAGQFSLHIWISLLAGVVLAFPWILYQMWRFISPGLSSKEQGYSVLFVTVSSLLLFAGALFGYYLIVPLSLRFLGNYVLSGEIQNIIETASYLNTVMSLILATGIMFELPILVFFLSRMGLTTAKGMKTYRRHAWIGILMLSAVITPPDVFSQILISIPVFLLYEVSILVSKYAAPKS